MTKFKINEIPPTKKKNNLFVLCTPNSLAHIPTFRSVRFTRAFYIEDTVHHRISSTKKK